MKKNAVITCSTQNHLITLVKMSRKQFSFAKKIRP